MILTCLHSRIAQRGTAGLGILGALFAFVACDRAVSVQQAQSKAVSTAAADTSLAIVQSDSGLRFPFVPDLAKTPGDTLEVTAADICVPGYSKKVRNVPIAVKRQVYLNYGIRKHKPGDYEIDHLISLELGGSNSIRNLWPQSYRTSPWNAHVKDALENELHRRVCAGTIDLATAQRIIAQNWVMGYRIYVNPNPPVAATRARAHTHRQYRPRSEPQPQAPVP
ncbi:MAG TPA: hypothetical protein VGJ12_01760 [Gemmatimonadaceae bacterium]